MQLFFYLSVKLWKQFCANLFMKKLFLLPMLFTVGASINAQVIEKVNYLGALDKDPKKDWTLNWTNWNPKTTSYGAVSDSTTLNHSSGEVDITTTVTLDAKKVYSLKSLVVVKSGGKLVIPAGTVIRGLANPSATPKEYATIVVERGGQIDVQGTVDNPVVFTSLKAAGSRDRGDWGGLVMCGNAVNNQGTSVQVEGFNNIAFNNQVAFFGGTNDNDNSGSIKYLRIEFGGYAFEPNKEINGLTMASVGDKTTIDHVQVSYSGDDSYEWFGGTVNLKHLIAYKGTDDDFDTDFGYRGTVQFGIAQRDTNYFDMSWNAASGASTSETFESDNDAGGSGKLPYTSARFVNMTCVGPVRLDKTWADLTTTQKGAFRRGARIRRNSRLSITNSIFMGYRNYVMFDGDSTLTASGVLPNNTVSNTNAVLRNNYFHGTKAATTRGTYNTGLVEISSPRNVDSLDAWVRKAIQHNIIDTVSFKSGYVLIDPQNPTAPNFRPVSTNPNIFGTSDYSFDNFKAAGTFVVCDSITRQPKAISLKTGSDAQFNFAYSTADATFQWQANTGSGFKNITNAGQYSGTNNDTLTISPVDITNNGTTYRAYISTRWCKDSTSAAKLTAILKACTIITTAPKSTSVASGNVATFNIATNDNAAVVKWQSDFDYGMMEVPTGNTQYLGQGTKTLQVAKVSLRNHNQPFRVIASTNVCSDTANTVFLTVSDSCITYKSVKVTDTLVVKTTLKVNNVSKENSIKVYPIPAQDKLTINTGDLTLVGGYTLKVMNTTGAVVYNQVINAQVYTVDLKTWATTGFYTLQLIDKSGNLVATKAIILE